MRKRKKVAKCTHNILLIDTVITEILELNKEYAERIKNVFKCASSTGEDRLCVLWGRSNISVGDRVQMKGRMKDDIFLAWSLIIMKKAKKECDSEKSQC